LFTVRIVAAFLLAQLAWAQGYVHLKSRDRIVTQPSGAGHYVLEFGVYPSAGIRQELARRGVRVLGYVPDSGLLISARATPDLRGLGVTWAGALDLADKIAPAASDSAPPAWLAIFHADVELDRARAIVAAEGFVTLENPNLIPGHLLVSGSSDNLTQLAAHDEVEYVMPASVDLVTGASVIGCAGAVTEAGLVSAYSLAGQGWSKGADGVAGINYVFESFAPHLDAESVRQEIERAFAEWQKYANVRFSPGDQPDAPRTIAILFAVGAHGDPYPFDGPGAVLAHTFYPAPPNAEPIAGDMHLDASENWQIGWGIDVFSVALHEAGHALGLAHSSVPGAVMYPYYRQVTGLASDDIAAIRALYGNGVTTAPTPPPTTPSQPPAQPPTPPVQPPTPPAQPPSKPDTTAPSLTIDSPTGSIVSTTASSIHVSGTASDNVGVSAVKWSTSSGDSGTATGTTSWSLDAPLLIGNTVITVRAYDGSGNSSWRAVTVVRR